MCDLAQAEIAFTESTWLRRMNFWILPVEVFGIDPNTTAFGVLNPDIWLRQKAMISASVVCAPSFSSTNAQGTSPHLPSGFATTPANSTAGCFVRSSSHPHEAVVSPPGIIMSFEPIFV